MSPVRLLLASAAILLGTVSARANTFALENSVGATPTFSITSGGNTATFSSTAGNQFQVQNTSGLLSFSTGLIDNNFFGTDPLTISFSAPTTGIVIPFAILDAFGLNGPDSLTVTANTGGSATYLGTADSFFPGEPEGIANFTLPTEFTSVTLTSNNAFAVGDVTTTPEPASLVMVVSGLASLALRRRRKA